MLNAWLLYMNLNIDNIIAALVSTEASLLIDVCILQLIYKTKLIRELFIQF